MALSLPIRQKYQSFKEWQKLPHQVKPMTDEEHDCCTCGTHYQGNYCPRCGQSAIVGRYSFKKALLLFLDVWGLGNRGMFRTLRDLLLRPGYMIRDYLSGMQMAYFPPFKMLFLLVAFSVLVSSGFNIKMENHLANVRERFEQNINVTDGEKSMDENEAEKVKDVEKRQLYQLMTSAKGVMKWITDHPTIVQLLWLLVFSGPLYLFFHRSPNIPDIRYSEFFVAMVYTTNMVSIYQCIIEILCLDEGNEIMAYVLTLIPLKQLSGYSYKRTLGNVIMALVLLILAFILLCGLVVGSIAVVQGWK